MTYQLSATGMVMETMTSESSDQAEYLEPELERELCVGKFRYEFKLGLTQ